MQSIGNRKFLNEGHPIMLIQNLNQRMRAGWSKWGCDPPDQGHLACLLIIFKGCNSPPCQYINDRSYSRSSLTGQPLRKREEGSDIMPIRNLYCCSQKCSPIRSFNVTINIMDLSKYAGWPIRCLLFMFNKFLWSPASWRSSTWLVRAHGRDNPN